MRMQKEICCVVLGAYVLATVGDSIEKQQPVELDEGIIPFFATVMSAGTGTALSAIFTAPF